MKDYCGDKSIFSEVKDHSTMEESIIDDKYSEYSEEEFSEKVELKNLFNDFNNSLLEY
jgi:hypothetical protein